MPRTDVVGMRVKRRYDFLRGHVPDFESRVVRTRQDLCRGEQGEFGDMDRLFVLVEGPQDRPGVDIKNLICHALRSSGYPAIMDSYTPEQDHCHLLQ